MDPEIPSLVDAPMLNYWGPPTATLDWCEENYKVTHLIAEFWNTLTNTLFLILASVGIYHVRKHKLEPRFIVSYVGMLLVGVGSCLFHTTLQFEMQLMDELPMLYATTFAFYSLVEMKGPPRYGAKLFAGLIVYCIVITALYLASLNPVFHQVAYGIEMLTILGRCVHLIRGVPEGPYKQSLIKLVWYSAVTFLAGFFLWNVDNIFCPQLRSARDYVNFPLEVVLQLHGWWHILTCMGCTGFILLTQALRIYYLGKHHKYHIRYFKGFVPYLQHCLESKD